MANRKKLIKLRSYGRYTKWDKTSREMPRVTQFTTEIEAVENNEFGIVIDVDYYKGKVLNFTIKHPPIKDENGNLLPQFKGDLHVNSRHAQFFVGDCIWPPVSEKVGEWEVIISYKGKTILTKTFNVIPQTE